MQNISKSISSIDPKRTSGWSDPAAGSSIPDIRFAAIAQAFGKWFWEFILLFSLIVVGGLLYIALARDPLYESEARLFVRVSQEQTPPGTVLVGNSVNFLTSASGDVTTEIDLLLSSDLFDRVIDDTGLEEALTVQHAPPDGFAATLRHGVRTVKSAITDTIDRVLVLARLKNELTLREAITTQMKRSIRVQNTTGSNVIVVSMVWGNREVPQPLLQAYLDAFIEFRRTVFRSNETTYFEQQKLDAAAEIDRLSAEQERLRAGPGIHSLDAQRTQLIAALETEIAGRDELVAELAVARTRLEAVNDASSDEGPPDFVLANIPDHPLLTALDQRLADLFSEAQRLLAQGQLGQLDREALREEYTFVVSGVLSVLEDYIGSLEIELSSSKDRIAELETRISTLSDNEASWRASERDLEIAEESYVFFADRLNEARSLELLREKNIGNIVVLQNPSDPRLSVTVRNATIMMIIVVLGLIVSLSWVALREYFDDRVRDSADIENLFGTPPLAVVRRRSKGPQVRQAMRRAATQVRQAVSVSAARTVAIAPIAEDPRSFEGHAHALATELSKLGQERVLLVNLTAWTGDGTRDVPVFRSNRDGATLPSDERSGDGILELSCHDEADADDLLDQLEHPRETVFDRVDLIVLAAPPVERSALGLRTVLLADKTVLSVRAGSDDMVSIERSLKTLRARNVDLVGAVLTNWQRFVPRFLYTGVEA